MKILIRQKTVSANFRVTEGSIYLRKYKLWSYLYDHNLLYNFIN